jgi:hypothetical protein
MKKLVFLLALSCTLVGCSDHYRYPCQDPDNFDKKECQHPVCEVDGMCSDDLVGHKVYTDVETQEHTAESPVVESSEHCNCEHKGE